MRRILKFSALLCVMTLTLLCLCGCGSKEPDTGKLDPKHPVSISVWHYYNGAQLAAFNNMVDLFNETRGKELGIVVTGYSQGSVNDLQTNVMNSVNGKVGAEEVPNIFAAYADTAYEIDHMGMLVDLAAWLTPEQRALYVTGYLNEGDFAGNGAMKIFPIAKSTELFLLNETDWQVFADATGASFDDLTTLEGVTETARRYYEWTDSLTDKPNDGKAFFGRDAMANYFIIGGMQMGHEIFSVQDGHTVIDFDKATVRHLWDNYYVPFIKGYFAASGRFRSDDIKTGNVIAFVGSSSGATFFPNRVATEDGEYPITMRVFPAPQFAGSAGYAVQQGAGMAVTRKSDAEIAASVEFLLWFTQDERNIRFSVDSGYMPVTWSANSMDAIRAQSGEISDTMDSVLSAAVETVHSNTLYTTKAFKGGVDARSILENRMFDQAVADRTAVKTSLALEMSLEDAVAPFVTDEYFDRWYDSVLDELNALEL